ncbi:sulfatase [Bythopirellula polymerisocia]|uniref:Choline-sulfatase n=1 Tax=Bythopirellula polymerisocia TaxID=2528003 RepID=A0A5C6CVQ8_9BACT|nr:sulfatase [Bythopirellula polymerisocia]TWU28642.1 Choline-sulfatase [Bythopirellula polymerisocia]
MFYARILVTVRTISTALFFFIVFSSTRAVASPNVLFIAVDDLNDWVGFLEGHRQVKTPNMDRLAQRGIVFSNGHCAAPLCGPSRAALFSGRQPFKTGVYVNEQQIRKLHPDMVLLPQYFHAHGYRTLGTGKLMHREFADMYDETFFTEQRWSPYASQEPQKTQESPRLPLRPLNGMPNDRQQLQPGRFSSFDWGAVEVEDDEMGDGKVINWAAEHLRQKADNKSPFFLACGFYRPHIPLYAPREYFDLYPVDSTIVPEVPSDDLNDVSSAAIALAHSIQTAGLHKSILQHGQWKDAVAAYLACISFVDAQIGQLLAALDNGPYAENTIVILWSDHGWHLGEKEHWGKITGWERATRVPLVIVPAKTDAASYECGSRCEETVGLIDLYPTLIDMCDLPAKPELDGVSLVPQLSNPAMETNRAVITTVDKGIYSVRDNRWRLIRYADGSAELYDHKADPNEWKNLVDDEKYVTVKERLAQSLPD